MWQTSGWDCHFSSHLISHTHTHIPPVAALPSTSPHPPSAICPCAMSLTETLGQQSLLGKTTLCAASHQALQTIILILFYFSRCSGSICSGEFTAYSSSSGTIVPSKNCGCNHENSSVFNPKIWAHVCKHAQISNYSMWMKKWWRKTTTIWTYLMINYGNRSKTDNLTVFCENIKRRNYNIYQ